MIIEAISCCINYSDFLAETIEHNRGLLDRWLIITTEEDIKTRELCRRYNLQCLLTNDHVNKGDIFNKGRLIERGLQHLSAEGWRLHLDADIALPQRFRALLEAAHLNQKKIYGCDRIMVKSYNDWIKLKNSGWLSNDFHHRVTPPQGYHIGTRWIHPYGGYVPIGFFQLWHSSCDQWRGVRIRPYPDKHNDACRSDVQFSLWWDRQDRELLPELLVVHLDSEKCENGSNWKGRKTKHFGHECKSGSYMG